MFHDSARLPWTPIAPADGTAEYSGAQSLPTDDANHAVTINDGLIGSGSYGNVLTGIFRDQLVAVKLPLSANVRIL